MNKAEEIHAYYSDSLYIVNPDGSASIVMSETVHQLSESNKMEPTLKQLEEGR